MVVTVTLAFNHLMQAALFRFTYILQMKNNGFLGENFSFNILNNLPNQKSIGIGTGYMPVK